MRYKLSIALFLFFLILACSKDDKNKKPTTATSDSLSIAFSIAQNENLTTDKRLVANEKAFSILNALPNDSLNRDKLAKVAFVFVKLRNETNSKKAINLLFDNSFDKNDTLNLAKSYNLFGNQKINIGQNDSAFYYLLKSEKLFLKLKDSLYLGQNYIDKAFVQMYESDYAGCEFSAFQALTYLKNSDTEMNRYYAYNLIAVASNESKNYENALIYNTKALEVVKINKLPTILHKGASSLNNLGVVYQYQNNHREAIVKFKEALQEKDLLKDAPYLYAMIIDNIAYSKFKLNDNTDLPDLFFEALKIREDNDIYSSIITNKIHLSEFYASKNDTVNSQKFANEALQMAKTTKTTGDLLQSLKQLSLVEHKNAAKYSNEYIAISDSIQQQERIAKDRFARIAYETDAIIEQKDKLEERNRGLIYFFSSLFAMGILLFVIRFQSSKNRMLLLRQQQQKANEEIYNLMISQQANIEENRVKEKKRIAQELHDSILSRMFGARLNLDSLNNSNDEQSIKNRNNYLNELKKIEQDIREISHDLNREKTELINNFVAIVIDLIEEQKSSFESDIKYKIDKEIKWERKNNAIKINLYRILQESLQNINKYAKAKNIFVEFKKDIDNIILKIVDDGIGFELNGRKKGIGLHNMLSRANECGGTCDINSKKGLGTTITITIPIQKIKINA